MAIREQGYRHWEGEYTSHTWRWWTITKASLRSTVYTKGRLMLLLMLAAFAWIMPFFFGVFYFFGALGERVRPPDEFLRENLYEMLRNWQWIWGAVFSAVVGSRLVSNDLRSEALYIYLAKPLRRIDYIIGKFLTCFVWTLSVTLAPALWVYLAGLGSANKALPMKEPAEILGELLAVYLVFALVCSACAVTLSSLTKRWAIALIAWVGAYMLLFPIAEITANVTRKPDWFYISPRHDVIIFAEHMFEQEVNRFEFSLAFPNWGPALGILTGLFAAATIVFVLRILRLEVAE
jgi:ABC-type transport system involved in multi-copper enzyme maturation permease subunit